MKRQIPKHQRTIFAYESSENSLKQALVGIDSVDDISVIIGPEGGFSEEEAEEIVKAGAMQVSLGTRILRAETAAIALLAIVSYEAGC